MDVGERPQLLGGPLDPCDTAGIEVEREERARGDPTAGAVGEDRHDQESSPPVLGVRRLELPPSARCVRPGAAIRASAAR